MSARLILRFAGPHVTVQDGGRPGLARFGVPASGAKVRPLRLALLVTMLAMSSSKRSTRCR